MNLLKRALHLQRALLSIAITIGFTGAASRAHATIDAWTSYGPGGGNITTIVFDPTKSGTVYAGTGRYPGGSFTAGAGGLFKSVDNGLNWRSVNPIPENVGVNDLLIDSANSSFLYVATDVGVFKSEDGGNHWEQTGLSYVDAYIESIASAPSDHETLYAGSVGVVFKTTNGGVTWSPEYLDPYLTLFDLWVDPHIPTSLLAATNGGVYRSSDSGETWNRVLDCPKASFTQFASSKIDPKVLYAGGESIEQICKSTDGGETWHNYQNEAIGFALAIDPTDPDTLYIGSGNLANEIYKSTDGAETWSLVGDGLPYLDVFAIAVSPSEPNTVLAGTISNDAYCGGLYRSTDGGLTWSFAGLSSTPVTSLAIDPITPTTIYTTLGCGGVMKSTDGGRIWHPANNGLSAVVGHSDEAVETLAVDPRSPSTLFVGANSTVFQSTDRGENWYDLKTGFGASVFSFDPASPSTIYASNYTTPFSPLPGSVFKSTDGGQTWTDLKMDFATPFIGIAASRPNWIYAGPCKGRSQTEIFVCKSTDGGMDWTQLPVASAVGGEALAFAIDPIQPDNIYLATLAGFYESTNAGTTWSRSPSYPDEFSLAIDPVHPNLLYMGTSASNARGVFKSSDRGLTWSMLNAGLTTPYVPILAINPRNPALVFAGTDGGSVFVINQSDVCSGGCEECPGDCTACPETCPICAGDCNRDGSASVDELVTLVKVALGTETLACDASDSNHDGKITVDEIVAAVNSALNGC